MNNPPRVGIGVMILKEGEVLLGKRLGKLGYGEYSFPGGHLEEGESFLQCALRETKEECGLEIGNVRFALLANIPDKFPSHYVQIGFVADWTSGEPMTLEPTKCAGWNWYPLDKLPQPLFFPTKLMIESYCSRVSFFDQESTEVN